MNIFIAVIVGIAGFVLGRATKKSLAPSSPEEFEEIQQASQYALNERTEDRKEKILEMMEQAVIRHEELKTCNIEEERRGIDRADVEKLLDVSKNTALSYLDELELDGKIQQIGRGKGVYYMLKK